MIKILRKRLIINTVHCFCVTLSNIQMSTARIEYAYFRLIGVLPFKVYIIEGSNILFFGGALFHFVIRIQIPKYLSPCHAYFIPSLCFSLTITNVFCIIIFVSFSFFKGWLIKNIIFVLFR